MNLYRIAQEQNIDVLTFPMPENESVSVMLPDGRCFIGMDKSVRENSAEENVHMAHEIGHCVTGAFYNSYSPVDIRQKHEHKADKWAIRQLIPQDKLTEAVEAGITEPWDLAELFDVTVQFMMKAIYFYKYGHVDVNQYFAN